MYFRFGIANGLSGKPFDVRSQIKIVSFNLIGCKLKDFVVLVWNQTFINGEFVRID